MINRVNKPLIGKDIARTSSLVLLGASQNLADGEIFVADKNKALLAAGSTVSDTDTIYIGQGTSSTYNYVNEAGTSVTNVRKIQWSEPIVANQVKTFTATNYAAATAEVATLSGSLTPVVGEEYVLKLRYKNRYDHPALYSHTYRHVATSTSLGDLYDAFEAKINKHKDGLVTAAATTGPDVLTLTAKSIPSVDTVDSIDSFEQVNFELFLTSDNFGSVVVTYTADPTPGQGTWQQVRDAEEAAMQNKYGATNKTAFPVIRPEKDVVKGETYDTIVIQHDRPYQSPDNQYVKHTPLTTVIYIPDGASQTADVLAVLNPWMESTGLNGVSLS